MSSPNFIDYVKFCSRSGSGGPGSAHFRREKFVPKGGPDGGDGGRGGHIILRGNKQLWTLLHLKYKKHVVASNGKPGEGGRRTGADGEDVILEVPLGTIAKNADTNKQLLEITEDGQEAILTHGGKGGLGNDHFKTPTNRTPRYAQPGESGIEEWLILELKVLADVGLVGFPNAGKSTLLSVISSAKPEIADYPFTTIIPNLGVVKYRDYKSFVVADIPGLIQGAAEGKGLGHRFLRHIERNSILLFMIPADSHDVKKDFDILMEELKNYNPELLDKKRVLAITKSDLLDEELRAELSLELPENIDSVFISSIANDGIDHLKDVVWRAMNE
ncbi:MAG: GTPase ObgE [Cyclobacteriaceae bacterium]|nr:GTPase ObgE [Cyclobacteriaceae bacterium]MCK5367458.1 GTPase ObgE [Cyclobacteriaceae bacterium]